MERNFVVLLGEPARPFASAVGSFADAFAQLASSTRRAAWAARFGLLGVLDPLHLSEPAACLTYRPEVFAATSQLLSSLAESARLVDACHPMSKSMPLVVLRHGRVGDLVGSAATLEEQKAAEPAWRSFQEGLAAQSSRGRLRVIEDSGHLIVNERPEAVVAAVQDVLETAAQ